MASAFLTVLFPSALAFAIGLMLQPWVSNFLYSRKLWKQSHRDDKNPDAFSKTYTEIHNSDEETKTPRIGGVLVWLPVVITAGLLVLIQTFDSNTFTHALDFTSRKQTLIPFVVLIIMSCVGLVDDLMQVLLKNPLYTHGFSRRTFVLIVTLLGLFGGWWFFAKLGITSISIPLMGVWHLGLWIIPVFAFIAFAVFSSGVIDGVDGLAGGVFAIIFASYGVIALVQGQYDLATLCVTITGALLAFVWFNVPPAKFYLGETGVLGLTSTLTFVAFLTDKALWLPIIAFPLALTSFSSAAQILAKKLCNKKIFKVAPIHHHFEAIGWSRPAIVMRYWIITLIAGILGVLLALLSL